MLFSAPEFLEIEGSGLVLRLACRPVSLRGLGLAVTQPIADTSFILMAHAEENPQRHRLIGFQRLEQDRKEVGVELTRPGHELLRSTIRRHRHTGEPTASADDHDVVATQKAVEQLSAVSSGRNPR
jgi:hypothetical protein